MYTGISFLASKTATVVHPFRLLGDVVKRFSSGPPRIGMRSLPALPKLPHLWPTFAAPLLTSTRC